MPSKLEPKINKIFVYDDLLNVDIRTTLDVEPISEVIAETTGKMYLIHREPIMFEINAITHNKGNRRVLGAIYEYTPEQMDIMLYRLDAYKACSQSTIQLVHPFDLTYRTLIKAYPIQYKDIHDIENFRYTYGKAVDCYVYLGNVNNPALYHAVKVDRHHKLRDGYSKHFKNLLKREGLL